MNLPTDPTAAQIEPVDAFRVPIGNQAIELQQVQFAGGGLPLLRLRIRERSRFTIFDIDPLTARRWAASMNAWADAALATAEGAVPGEPPHE